MFKALFKYLGTDPGRNALGTAAIIGGTSVFGANVLLHTAFLDKYRNFVQLYRNGIATLVKPELTRTVSEVVDAMKLSEKYRAYLKTFYVQGFDPYYMGSLKTRGGAYIGLPGNFDYQSTGDIEKHKIMVDTKPVAWGSDDGQLLQEAIVLSENAQKFAIARQISHLDTHHVYLYGLIPTVALTAQYFIAAAANMKFYGHFKPKSFRYTVYSLVAVFTYGIYATATDALTRYYEEWTDSNAASLGINYAKGGVEFYTKLVQRNMALRELMGTRGESMYTKFGNTNELFRRPHIPPLIRKENLEKKVQEYLLKTNTAPVSSDAVYSEKSNNVL